MRAKETKSLHRLASKLPALKNWYVTSHRKFLWRKATPNPYEVWISEVMSQQSVMKSVIPFYERWMQRFPTLRHLAEAKEADVIKQWTGLGYYARARNVLKCAKQLQEFITRHNRWPKHVAEWLQFAGVGPYTAAAVCSIAFDEPTIPIDGNVTRVFSRIFKIQDPLNLKSDLERIHEKANKLSRLIPAKEHGLYSQALMELGATLCRPKQPQCDLCPIKGACAAGNKKQGASYPLPKIRAQTRFINRVFLAYEKDGRLLFRKIPKGRPLYGHLELPYLDIEEADIGSGAKNKKPQYQIHQPIENIKKIYDLRGPVRHSIMTTTYLSHIVYTGPWIGPIPKGHYLIPFKNFRILSQNKDQIAKEKGAPISQQSLKVLALLDGAP